MSAAAPPPAPPPPPPPPPAPTPVEAPHVHPRRRVVLLGARVLVWVVYAYVVITEIVLALGFLLLLFGANSDASFVAWVYRSLDRAMEPFRGMFTPIDLGLSGNDEVGAVLDTSVLFAMLVYAVVAWLVSWLLDLISELLMKLDVADRQAWLATHQSQGQAGTTPTGTATFPPAPPRTG